MLPAANLMTVALSPPAQVSQVEVAKIQPGELIQPSFQSEVLSTTDSSSLTLSETLPQTQPHTLAQADMSPAVDRVFVPFLLEGEEVGQVLVSIFPDGRIQFPATAVLEATRPLLQDQPQQQLESAIDAEGFLTLEDFRQAGIEAEFDQRQLVLEFNIPPQLKPQQVIDLGDLPPEARNAVPVSDLSGWINMRFQQGLDLSVDTAGSNPFPFLANFESVINYQGWILENDFSVQPGGETLFDHERMTLIRDHPKTGIRYRAGDFFLPTVGFQSGGTFTGVAVTKDFSLLPYQRIVPTETIDLFLEEPATVEIYINDRLSQTLELPEGQQTLRNLSLSTGRNNFRAVITTESGEVRVIDFNTPFDFRLLDPGLEEFSYGFGLPQVGEDSTDFSQLTLSAFHRLGITDTLTLGGYLQGTVEQQLLGFEGVWATSLGSFDFDTACSHAFFLGIGCAAEVNYRYFHDPLDTDFRKNFNVSFEYRNENFIRPQQSQPNNDFTYKVSANYRQPLWEDFSLNLGLNYQFGGQDDQDASGDMTLGLSQSIPLGNNLQATVGLTQRFNFNQPNELGANLSLSWLIPQTSQVVNASVNTLAETNQVTWSSVGSSAIAPFESSVVFLNTPDQNLIDTDLEYKHPRGSLRLNQNLGLGESFNSLDPVNRLELETAVAFADGYFALTRPITNSFVLIAPHPNLEGYPILLNPAQDLYEAKVDQLGAGVIPDLVPYQVSKLLVDAPELPLGYDLGPSSYTLFPSYRSGTLIRVGSAATVFLRGTLVNAECEAIGLETFEVIALDNPDWEPITFFTNRVGRFAAPSFQPGQYEIRQLGQPAITTQFTIPESTTGLYNLGTLSLPKQANCDNFQLK